jgi:RNA polymerase sigma factor (sigma-70 family)
MLDRLVARVAKQYGLTVDDLPDLGQEARIALWELGLDLPVSAHLVLRIASNKAVDLIRRRMRRRARDRAAASLAPVREEDAELHHLLNAQVEALSPNLREFYELHYHQGLSEREVARALGICRASVRWLDHQFRRLMAGADPPTPQRRG